MTQDSFFVQLEKARELKTVNRIHESRAILKALGRQSQPSAEGWVALAIEQSDQGLELEAEASWRRVIDHDPSCLEALFQLGVLLQSQQRLEEAEDLYRWAVSIHPRQLSLRINHGSVLLGLGKYEEAMMVFFYAQIEQPDHEQIPFFLGLALQHLNEHEQAVSLFHEFLERHGEDVQSLIHLAISLWKLDRPDLAIDAYRRAQNVDPNNLNLALNIAHMHVILGELNRAIRRFKDILERDPDYLPAYPQLLFALSISQRQEVLGMPEFAKTYWQKSRLVDASPVVDVAAGESDPEDSSSFAGYAADDRLRIGILSAEIGDHVVGQFLLPLLEYYDRKHFSIDIISCHAYGDDDARRLCQLADAHLPIERLGIPEARQRIRQGHYDIILETSGHTPSPGLRILAERCAPVQCHYAGFHATTGLDQIDFFIGDHQLLAAELQDQFVERFWRLPRPWLARKVPVGLPVARSVADSSGPVFGCFNQSAKIRDETLAYWAAALHRVPDSRLYIKDRMTQAPCIRERILASFAASGVDPDRISFHGKSDQWSDHMQHFNHIDIAFDTTPWSGATTTFDTLSMGVPLIAIQGDTVAARMSSAIVHGIGREQWIVLTPERFAELACELSADLHALRHGKPELQQHVLTSALYDSAGLARSLEQAFVAMGSKQNVTDDIEAS